MTRAYSLQRRLTLVVSLGFALVVGGVGIALMVTLRDSAVAEFDAALLAKARALEALTEQEKGHIEFDYKPKLMPEFGREDAPDHFQFWLDDGMVLLRSARLREDLPCAGATTTPTARDCVLQDGRAGRVIVFSFTPGKHKDIGDPADAEDEPDAGLPLRGLVLAVARDRGALDLTLASLQTTLAWAGLAAGGLAALLAWWALALGFRPVAAVAAQVRALEADDLAESVGVDDLPAEVAPVVQQLNALLHRLHTAFARQRRFADNLAHELRTPIAELRALAAVGARWPDDQSAVLDYFRDVGAIASRMDGILADLLLLARCRAGVEQATRFPVHLRQLLATAWERFAAAASARGMRLRLEVPHDLVIDSDPGKLGIIVANLLDNATSHARPGSDILCRAAPGQDGIELAITNAAEPMSERELACLGEPFWRRDDARAGDRHAGLGLSLVTALTELLGLGLRFEQREAAFTVRVKRLAPADAVDAATPLRRVP